MKKTEIEVEVVLPGVDLRDGCVSRLNALIEARNGIDKAHINKSSDEPPNKICIHFDPDVISLGEIRQFAIQAGANLGNRYGHLLFKTSAMNTRRARALADQLEEIEGVLDSMVVGVVPDHIERCGA